MRHLAWKAHGLRALALGLVCAAAPALANVDGTLDTSLNPPLGVYRQRRRRDRYRRRRARAGAAGARAARDRRLAGCRRDVVDSSAV